MLPCNRGSASRKKHHDVFAVLGKAALVSAAEAFAKADQQKQGTDSPGDAEHGKKRAQFVRPEGAKDLRENVEHHLHG